uniref:Putative secreted protein n=1 Tax=Rhipicephalus microplus TaxID=6941 RepID=A0A6M2DBH1_RHIMP
MTKNCILIVLLLFSLHADPTSRENVYGRSLISYVSYFTLISRSTDVTYISCLQSFARTCCLYLLRCDAANLGGC